jgi:hypothetical protein
VTAASRAPGTRRGGADTQPAAAERA